MSKNFQFSIFNFQKKGFTLIETLVAITILTLAISGSFFTANNALVVASIARDQLTASHLAQEGIEYVRMMRDDAYLNAYKDGMSDISSAAWNDFLDGSSAWSITECRTTTCTLDPSRQMGIQHGSGNVLSLHPCSISGSPSCDPLRLMNNAYIEDSSNSAGVVTPFTRTVQAVDISPNDERIVSIVMWNFHNASHSITITDHLTPWQ